MVPLTVVDGLMRDGYAVLPAALDPAWIGRLRVAFAHAPPQGDGTQHVRIDDATPERASWTALHTHPAIGAAAARVLGRPSHVRDAHGRNPLPGYGQQGLHTDWPRRALGDPPFVLTAIWMLDDFTETNGATRVVPGSHLSAAPIPKRLAQPLAHHPDERLVTGRAGSVLFFDGHLWHSGTRNVSGGARRAVQMVLLADDAKVRGPR